MGREFTSVGPQPPALAPPAPPPGIDSLPPPPPPPPSVRRRVVRGRKLLALAGGGALILAAGLSATLLLTRGAVHPAKAAQSATAAAHNLALLKQQYGAARYQLNSQAATFQAAIENAVDSNDFSEMPTFAERYSLALQSFDTTVLRLDFPSNIVQDVHGMVSADSALAGDLDGFAALTDQTVDAWVTQWTSDVAKAKSAHKILNADLGLPDATPPAGAAPFPI